MSVSGPAYRKALFGKSPMERLEEDAAKGNDDPLGIAAAQGAVTQQKAGQQAANEAAMKKLDQPQWVDGAPDWYTNSPHRTRFQNNMFGNNKDGNPNNPVKSLTFDEANFARKANILDKLLQMRRVKMNPYSN